MGWDFYSFTDYASSYQIFQKRRTFRPIHFWFLIQNRPWNLRCVSVTAGHHSPQITVRSAIFCFDDKRGIYPMFPGFNVPKVRCSPLSYYFNGWWWFRGSLFPGFDVPSNARVNVPILGTSNLGNNEPWEHWHRPLIKENEAIALKISKVERSARISW